MKYDFDGKTLLVTGATSGLGRGLTRKLIENHSCHVIGIGRSKEKFDKLSQSLGEKAGLLTPIIMDVGDSGAWQNLAAQLCADGIALHGIINCAGVLPPFKRAVDYTKEDAEGVLKTDYLSCVYSISALYRTLSQVSDPIIANISSAAALASIAGSSIYTAAKSALKGYTEAMREELRGSAYVCLIMPGFARTDIFRSQNTSIDENKLIRMMSTPEDKMVNKIYRGLIRRRPRIIAGKDARLMNFFYRLCPKTTNRLIARVLRRSHIKLFEDVFPD